MTEHNWQDFALLLVDVQHDFWNEELKTAFPNFQQNTAELLEFCRRVGIEVIHLREVFSPDKSDWLPRYLFVEDRLVFEALRALGCSISPWKCPVKK
jgi:nicotinamidase-related amidase